jgi:hypothetical protein
MERQFIFKKFDLAQLADGYVFSACGRDGRLSRKKRTFSVRANTNVRFTPDCVAKVANISANCTISRE